MWDVYAGSYRMFNHSGWVHQVFVQEEGPSSDRPTVYMEFEGPVEYASLVELLDAIERGAVSERYADMGPTLGAVSPHRGTGQRELDYDPDRAVFEDCVTYGWTTPALSSKDLEAFVGRWSFTPEMLDGPVRDIDWVLANPDSPDAYQVMAELVTAAQLKLRRAEAMAVDARSRLDIGQAWLLGRIDQT